ncbi:MAG: hypothetical protein JXA28_07500, partial [Bacteroidetes bacterium]|nr:hypothetical protein [Bacteroidota bacterium]
MWRHLTAVCITLIAMTLCAGAQNLSLVKDINPSTDESVLMMNSFDVLNGIVYFNGNDGSGNKLWRTDGTVAGTYMVKDIIIDPSQWFIRAYDGKVYFVGNYLSDGLDPWVSDGTAAGTFRLNYYRVKRTESKVLRDFCGMNGKMYFTYCIMDGQRFPIRSSYEIWETDGTVNGTGLVYPFYYTQYTRSGTDRLYIYGNDGNTGVEPWIS